MQHSIAVPTPAAARAVVGTLPAHCASCKGALPDDGARVRETEIGRCHRECAQELRIADLERQVAKLTALVEKLARRVGDMAFHEVC